MGLSTPRLGGGTGVDPWGQRGCGVPPEPPALHPPLLLPPVGYDPKNKQHHSLLLCLLMTSCDLSDQTKGWKTTRKIAVSAMGGRGEGDAPTPTPPTATSCAQWGPHVAAP